MIDTKSFWLHYDNDKSFVEQMLDLFETHYPETLAQIFDGIETSDCHKVEVAAHTLKGMLINFFEDKLANKALQIEKDARDKKLTEAITLMKELENEIPTLINEIKVVVSAK